MELWQVMVVTFFASTTVVYVYLENGQPLPPLTGYMLGLRNTAREKSSLFNLIHPLMVLISAKNNKIKFSLYRKYLKNLEKKLAYAGYPAGLRAAEFAALTQIVCVSFFLLGIQLSFVQGQPNPFFLIVIPAIIITYAHIYIDALGSRRRKRFDHELPYAISLIVFSLEAGLTFTSALRRLVETKISASTLVQEEFRVVLSEMDLNIPIEETLESLRARMPSEILRGLVVAVLQSNKLGSPLAQTLREQAEVVQRQRIASAEKFANEAMIKLVLPTALIFISSAIVVMGPLILRVIKGSNGIEF